MRYWFVGALAATVVATAALTAIIVVPVARTMPQKAQILRTVDDKPNFSGLWQALNEANWDLQAHEARAGAVTQPGVYPYDYARVPAAPVLALG